MNFKHSHKNTYLDNDIETGPDIDISDDKNLLNILYNSYESYNNNITSQRQ
ncbi:5081_t:CDS:1, partial [Scutellospora calospora]